MSMKYWWLKVFTAYCISIVARLMLLTVIAVIFTVVLYYGLLLMKAFFESGGPDFLKSLIPYVIFLGLFILGINWVDLLQWSRKILEIEKNRKMDKRN